MSTAERGVPRVPRWLLVGAGLLAVPSLASAHPVAQGRLRVEVHAEHIAVRATVPMEEVLVPATQLPVPASLAEALRAHGSYLASHLRVMADGRALAGHAVEVPAAESGGWPQYALAYGPTTGAALRVELSQDVLREFPFAPGNNWEASYLVTIGPAGQRPEDPLLLTSRRPLVWLDPSRAQAARRAGLAVAFVRHGIGHILGGWDHLLFVAALVLAVASLRDLVKVVAAFTLAHTLTLTLAALGLVHLPGAVVEPMIALSIICVALQNVLWPERSRGSTRLLVAFAFGLFHGLGFAGGLLESMAGLPTRSALVAIAAFSLGVELGHQAVVLPTFLGLRWLRGDGYVAGGRGGGERPVRVYGSGLIALTGSFYLAATLR